MKSIVFVLFTSACMTSDISDASDPGQDDCGASDLQYLLGQDMSVLATMTFPQSTRIINEGDAVTMDFFASRLNIVMDSDGKITRVWCG